MLQQVNVSFVSMSHISVNDLLARKSLLVASASEFMNISKWEQLNGRHHDMGQHYGGYCSFYQPKWPIRLLNGVSQRVYIHENLVTMGAAVLITFTWEESIYGKGLLVQYCRLNFSPELKCPDQISCKWFWAVSSSGWLNYDPIR